MLIMNFPHNPTTMVVEGLEFLRRSWILQKENNIIVIHDFAYADLVFDDYKAPSFCRFETKDVGVEFSLLQKAIPWQDGESVFALGIRMLSER